MSVKLRLTRMGNKKRSFFRIVATNTCLLYTSDAADEL